MKMSVCNILIGCFLFFAAISVADVVFQETFDNPDGVNLPLTNVNWNAAVTTNGTVYTSVDGANGPILSSAQFLYTTGSGAGLIGQPWLAWTEKEEVSKVGSIAGVTSISMKLTNAATNENIKVALKVGGNWYVSQLVFNNVEANVASTVSFDVQSVSWNSLTFVSGSTLVEGGAVGPPSGTVQAVGVFDAVAGDGSNKVRIDNFTIEAEVVVEPELSAYDEWAHDHSLVGGAYDDDDQDGVVNLYEFGTGGNPTNELDAGYSCEYELSAMDGSDWLVYVYPMMSATNSGLLYALELTDDLVSGNWTNAGYEVVGTGTNTYATGFDAITNQVQITDPAGFVRLKIGRFFFLENFDNSLGANTSLDLIGWHANVGTDAQILDSSASHADGPILSSASMMFFRPGLTVGIPWLGWADVTTACDISDVTNINIRLSNDNLSEDLKIAFKIDGSWYVSQDVVNNPVLGWNYVNLDVKASGWNSLTFVSGVELSEGSAVSLPASGTVQAVGVFDAATTVGEFGETSVRVDDLRIDG